MKAKIFISIFVFFTIISCAQAQSQIEQKSPAQNTQIFEKATYQLFPTENYWTFIKLDTRNGKIWQVHFTVGDGIRSELILNEIPLVDKEKEVNGRFTLYSTKNMYSFLLLDQINGYVYQVQWAEEEEYRTVIPILNFKELLNKSIQELSEHAN